MTCAGCANAVEDKLRSLSGVKDVTISLSTNHGRITYDGDAVGPRDILKTVEVRSEEKTRKR